MTKRVNNAQMHLIKIITNYTKFQVITNPPAELRLLMSDSVYVLEQFDFGYSKFETFGSSDGGVGGGTSVSGERLFA
jgi:hypothetical protein